MEKKLEYEKLKFTDWSKTHVLSQKQLKQLIAEKIARAKAYSEAAEKVYRKLG